MSEYICARCLFCETGKETEVVRSINERGWDKAIFARRVRFIWRNKKWVETETPLLPGYVFVYSLREDPAKRADYLRILHVIRVLAYDNDSDRLMGRDLEFADWLWRLQGKIDVIKAAQIGDHVEIVDDGLKQMRGRILRLNKRQHKMLVSIDTVSIPMQVWLSYELVETVEEGK